MNLNKFKKTIRTIKPERGLKDLVGAQQKAELRDKTPGTIRVTGKYIPGHQNTHITRRVLGIISYIASWIAGSFMILSLSSPELNLPHPLEFFITGFLITHACTMLADGMQGSDAPWARKSLIIFWSMAGVTFMFSLLS